MCPMHEKSVRSVSAHAAFFVPASRMPGKQALKCGTQAEENSAWVARPNHDNEKEEKDDAHTQANNPQRTFPQFVDNRCFFTSSDVLQSGKELQMLLLIAIFGFLVSPISSTSSTISSESGPEIFSSIAEMESLFKFETKLDRALASHVQKLTEQLSVLNQFLAQPAASAESHNEPSHSEIRNPESSSFTSPDGKSRDESRRLRGAANPLDSYAILKRLSIGVQPVQEIISAEESIIADNSTSCNNVLKPTGLSERLSKATEETRGVQLPITPADLSGAVLALANLRETYNLSINDLQQGRIQTSDGVSAPGKKLMAARDCMFIGKHAFNQNNYGEAVDWLEVAFSLSSSEHPNATSEAEVLPFLQTARRVKVVGKAREFLRCVNGLTEEHYRVMVKELELAYRGNFMGEGALKLQTMYQGELESVLDFSVRIRRVGQQMLGEAPSKIKVLRVEGQEPKLCTNPFLKIELIRYDAQQQSIDQLMVSQFLQGMLPSLYDRLGAVPITMAQALDKTSKALIMPIPLECVGRVENLAILAVNAMLKFSRFQLMDKGDRLVFPETAALPAGAKVQTPGHPALDLIMEKEIKIRNANNNRDASKDLPRTDPQEQVEESISSSSLKD
ncbi:unnamed protein product [Notodromas monacha]|uniref:Prolyl 4-hydroxylase N-terminal domain-containing protein n=1 Tax=Notodromas monacha TaxID=399045 RepID=A0A7R9GGB8_9CRUS|nr:unnamed protein product [Notodromas monacha]CAG0920214.1 unnamed protein product [Notodromas monacha]